MFAGSSEAGGEHRSGCSEWMVLVMGRKKKSTRRSKTRSAPYRLVWRQGRRTPIVVKKGQRVRAAKKGEGKIVRSRSANASELRTIRKGGWVRVAKDGSKPGQARYMKKNKSRVRPKFN